MKHLAVAVGYASALIWPRCQAEPLRRSRSPNFSRRSPRGHTLRHSFRWSTTGSMSRPIAGASRPNAPAGRTHGPGRDTRDGRLYRRLWHPDHQEREDQPFSLDDVFTLDTPYIRKTKDSVPPAAYSWWPFRGFGLRDSNLSPDFPTSAQLSLHQLALEGGPDAQGVVAVTAPVIAQALEVVGPIEIPEYHETVTAQNMEGLVRLYTETPPPGPVPIMNSSCS